MYKMPPNLKIYIFFFLSLTNVEGEMKKYPYYYNPSMDLHAYREIGYLEINKNSYVFFLYE